MEPDEYRRRTTEAAAGVVATVKQLLDLLPDKVDDALWLRFLRGIYDQVMLGRQDTFDLATEFYKSQRPTTTNMPDFVERSYPPESLQKALGPTRARLVGLDELLAEDRQIAADEAAAIIERQVVGAGRDNITDATNHDKTALGYARVPSGAETCAFCTMLVSRGPVYKNRKTASERANGEPYHNHCDCVPVPVFDRKNWPGRGDYLAAQKLWNDVTGGHQGRSALNALRRHLYAPSAS